MVFSGKEGIHWYFFVFFDQMCTTLLICISNHAFLVCLKYKCHINNKLFINLACSVCTEKYRPWVFLCKPRLTRARSVRYFSVKTSRSVSKKLETLINENLVFML